MPFFLIQSGGSKAYALSGAPTAAAAQVEASLRGGAACAQHTAGAQHAAASTSHQAQHLVTDSPCAGAQPPEVFQEAVQRALKEGGAASGSTAAGGESAANGGSCTREGCT